MRNVRRQMASIPGTEGYEKSIRSFVEVSLSLNFHEVCKEFLAFLPPAPSRVLDVGAGVGQNSAALAKMGHSVIAVEPIHHFLSVARDLYSHLNITWQKDSLPLLGELNASVEEFDFILVEGVWHHLTERERVAALERFMSLLKPGGKCAVSLRNGPPGLGTRTFPTQAENTVRQAETMRMTCIFRVENLPSIIPSKEDVSWSRIVLQK